MSKQQDSSNDALPQYIQVNSTLEFSRLVCALERTPRLSFLHDHNGQKILSVMTDTLMDNPVIYYTPLEHDGHYLSYELRSGKEESGIVDSIADTGKLYSPIIRIKSLPKSLLPGSKIHDKYTPIELEDASSLVNLTWNLDDVLFPLFLFPHGDKWMLGLFITFTDGGTAYFCHVVLDDDPQKPFLKFSTTNGRIPEFVHDPSEHGYSYIKIIRLKDTHPLIDYDHLQN